VPKENVEDERIKDADVIAAEFCQFPKPSKKAL
jgi:hypothetical protein